MADFNRRDIKDDNEWQQGWFNKIVNRNRYLNRFNWNKNRT